MEIKIKQSDELIKIIKETKKIIEESGLEITLELIGSWVWVYDGNEETKKIREALKLLGFKFANQKKKWFFAENLEKSKKRYKQPGFQEIKDKYGCVSYDKQKQTRRKRI